MSPHSHPTDGEQSEYDDDDNHVASSPVDDDDNDLQVDEAEMMAMIVSGWF